MGITGLLPFLKKSSKKSHIRQFSGYTVAVDGFCWLHKGAFGCAQKLGLGEPTTAYITYFMKYVNLLREHGITPILVFDGRSLPAKAPTDIKRRESRLENRKKAKEALRVGNKKEAWECFSRSVEITTAMVRDVLRELRREKLDYIIAPYEADAQLAFLARKGIVDMVITEDSDLVLFGCPKIFFKLNANGDGVLFDQSKIHLCMDISVSKFQFEKFRHMCIISGCDYLPSLNGVGLGRAKKVVSSVTHNDVTKMLKQIPSICNLDITVPNDYIENFLLADKAFLYQIVFDPLSRKLVPLNPYPAELGPDSLPHCGKYETPALALDMSIGNVDVKTLQRVDKFNIDDPKNGYTGNKSMWSRNYRIGVKLPPSSSKGALLAATTHTPTKGLKIAVSSASMLKRLTSVNGEQSDDLRSTEVEMKLAADVSGEDLFALYGEEAHATEVKIEAKSDPKKSNSNPEGEPRNGLKKSISILAAFRKVTKKTVYDKEEGSSEIISEKRSFLFDSKYNSDLNPSKRLKSNDCEPITAIPLNNNLPTINLGIRVPFIKVQKLDDNDQAVKDSKTHIAKSPVLKTPKVKDIRVDPIIKSKYFKPGAQTPEEIQLSQKFSKYNLRARQPRQ